MKKILLAFLSLLGVLSLASCGDDPDPASTTKKTVIQYCGWNLGTEAENNLTRRMIEKFNNTSETIRIEMVEPQGSYNEFLNTMASASNLPDVFLVNSVPDAVTNGLAAEITDVTTTDTEWANVEGSLKEAITYNSKVYAIPSAQNYMGLFANYDVIDNYLSGNVDAVDAFEAGKFTTDEWMNAVKQVKDINKTDGTGIIGMNAVGDMINWLPASLDTTGEIRHFIWDGNGFDYKSTLMINSLSKIQELGSLTGQYVFSSIPEKDVNEVEVRSQIFGSTDAVTVFKNGQMGFLQGGTWDNMSTVDFNYKFVAYPDAKVVSAADFMCISAATKNKDAAYEVAKYLTFGADGINARYDIIEENPNDNLAVTGLPINTDLELTTKWFDSITLKGVKEVFEKVSNGEITVLVEGNKTVPGFQAARFNFNTGIAIEGVRDGVALTIGNFIWDVCEGAISMNDYNINMSQALSDRLNKEITDAYERMGITR